VSRSLGIASGLFGLARATQHSHLHKTSLMRSLVHPIGSCEGPACVAHPYPFLSVSVTRSSIESHYYIASGRAASGRVTLLGRVSLHRVSLCRVTSHRVALHRVTLHRIALHQVVSLSLLGSRSIGSHCIRSRCIGSHYIGSHYIGFALRFSPCHFSFCLCVPEPFLLL